MTMAKWLAALLLSCFAGGAAYAATYANGLLVLDVPPGFGGPERRSPNPKETFVTFVAPVPGGTDGMQLQIAIYQASVQPEDMTEQARQTAASHFLMQRLGEIEKQHKLFIRSPVSSFRLDGRPAARVRWSDSSQGGPVQGTMYCLLLGRRIISFHVQAPGNAPKEMVAEAVRAIELVRFAD